LYCGFVDWDDYRYIVDNPLFSGRISTYVLAAITRMQLEAYQPVHLLSYVPDRILWPTRPAGFHAVNLSIFAVDIFLIFSLASRRASPLACACAALLFAVHPLSVEPVAWISARKDLIAVAFFIGVLLVEDRRTTSASGVSKVGIALCAGAFLSKTSTVCLPLILWGWLVWMQGITRGRATRRVAPYLALAVLPALIVLTTWDRTGMIAARPVSAPIDVLSTLATYARRILWPTDLAAVYPVEMPTPIVSAAVASAILAALMFSWRLLSPTAKCALFSFLVALGPVANVISINLRFADRYAFLALLLLVPFVAIALDRLFAAKRAIGFVACGLALATIALTRITVDLNRSWATSLSLWSRAVRVHPGAHNARIHLGIALVELHAWSAAIDQFQTVVRMLPDNAYGYGGLLWAYADRAEQEGRIPKGTAERWSSEFDLAQHRSSTMDALLFEIPRSVCPQCVDILLILRLRRWPKPDPVLREAARAALDEHSPDMAAILLDAARDKNDARWKPLWSETEQALRVSGLNRTYVH
jgi:hypothetical protein